jgi:hypothetical protein
MNLDLFPRHCPDDTHHSPADDALHSLADRLVACADYDTRKISEDIAPFSGAIILDMLLNMLEASGEMVKASVWELLMSMWLW